MVLWFSFRHAILLLSAILAAIRFVSLSGGGSLLRLATGARPIDHNLTTEALSLSSTTTRRYPRWEDANGIDLEPLLEFIDALLHNDTRLFHHSYLFPETPYVMNASGIFSSSKLVGSAVEFERKNRYDNNHNMMLQAWEILLQDDGDDLDGNNQTNRGRWPLLRQAVLQKGGLPFVIWYGNNRKCNYHNWKGAASLPLFTMCTPVDCNYTLPLPSYETYRAALSNSDEWQAVATNYSLLYPWESKIPQIFWRGSIYLTDPDLVYSSVRWRLLERVASSSGKEEDHVNAHATKVAMTAANLSSIGGLGDRVSMLDYQKYKAILDMDGMSWSSRFSALLCYNSVVVKVEPEFVDYFFYDHGLEPWTHYIPVKNDLSDWEERVAFVVDPNNDEQLRDIVAAANQWCHTHLLDRRLEEDALDLFEFYVGLLQKHDPYWMKRWQAAQEGLELDLDVKSHLYQMYPYLNGG